MVTAVAVDCGSRGWGFLRLRGFDVQWFRGVDG